MDPVLPKTPTKELFFFGFGSIKSFKGTVKSKISALASSPGKENSSPNGCNDKPSTARSFKKAFEQQKNDVINLFRSPKGNNELQGTLIERSSTASPYKSIRMANKKQISRRKSLNIFDSFKQHNFGSKSYKQEANNKGSYDVSNSCEPAPPFIKIGSTRIRDPYGPALPSKNIDSDEKGDPKPGIIEMNSMIGCVVDKMVENRHFYPPGFWETVSAGEELLRRPRPYKSLKNIPSKEDIRCLDLDGYPEETNALRTPTLPRARPSSHKQRYVSTAPVRVKFPWSGYMEVYASRDKAITDLFEKSSHLAERCIWDPVNRIFEAYPLGQHIFPPLTGFGLNATSYFWLPTHSWKVLQDPLADALATGGSPEIVPFRSKFIDDYECESLENSLRRSGCRVPHPNQCPKAKNESSLAMLSAGGFDLVFEPDSNMSEGIDNNESLEEREPLTASARIRDIIRPESVASSWFIPSNESREGSPFPTWMELERMLAPPSASLAGRSLSQSSTAFGSTESVEQFKEDLDPLIESLSKSHSCHDSELLSSAEAAIAEVTKNALNIDHFVWDGFFWNEIFSCGMTSNNVNPRDRDRDIEVVAAVDHVEHVSGLIGIGTWFQPGQLLQRDSTTEKLFSRGACPRASTCCHFHDASGRILTLQCAHDSGELFNENERSLDEAYFDALDALMITAVQDTLDLLAESFNINKRTVEGALSQLDEILLITAKHDADESFNVNKRFAEDALSEVEDILRITAEQDFQDELEELFRKNEQLIKEVFLELALLADTFLSEQAFEEAFLRISHLSELFLMNANASESFSKNERFIYDFLKLSPPADLLCSHDACESFNESERSVEEISEPDNLLPMTVAQDVETKTESLSSTEPLDPEPLKASTNSNRYFPSGFNFSIYSDILEEDSNRSTGQNEPDSATIHKQVSRAIKQNTQHSATVHEQLNRSLGTSERNPLTALEVFNIRLVGKAATPERKNVQALVNLFQAHDMMSQTPPILQSSSRLGTPPGFQRSNECEPELGIRISNTPEVVHGCSGGKQRRRTSRADTDVSSEFGEVLVRVEAKVNH